MSGLPALDIWIERLREIGAPVVRRLRPGAAEREIDRVTALPGVTLTGELKAYWSRVNGIDHAEPWDHSHFFNHIYLPLTTEDAMDHATISAELREDTASEPLGGADFWPEGMIRFGGENGNGLHVNCIAGSPTCGTVYERVDPYSALLRVSNSMQAFFQTLIEALEDGAIEVAGTANEDASTGALVTDYDHFSRVARRLNPDCPGHDPSTFIGPVEPDWQ